MPISQLNKGCQDAFLEDVQTAIKQVCDEHGLQLECFKSKQKLELISLNLNISWLTNGLNRHQVAYIDNAVELGLDPRWMSSQIIYQSQRFEILGAFLNRYKNPILVKNHTKNQEAYIHPDQVIKMWSKGKPYWRTPLGA